MIFYQVRCGCGQLLFKTPDHSGAAHDLFCRTCHIRVTVTWALVDGELRTTLAANEPPKRGPLANTGRRVVRSSA